MPATALVLPPQPVPVIDAGGLVSIPWRSSLQNALNNLQAQITALAALEGDTSALEAALAALQAEVDAAEASIAAHIADTANPHATTAAQVGADPVGTAAAEVAAHEAALDPHPQYLTEAEGDAAYQPLDATLTALSGQDWALNALPIGSGADMVSQVAFAANTFPARASTGDLVAKPITDFALTILDDANDAAVRATIGAGTVTSVAVANATGITWAGSPITTSGTLTPTLSANLQSWSGIAPASKADDSAVVHNTGAESVGGAKTFSSAITVSTSGSVGFQVITSNANNALCNYETSSGNIYAGQGTANVFAVGPTSNLNPTANQWLRVGAAFVGFGTDNTASCFEAVRRSSVVYSATGTINTSDAREKTPVDPLTSDEIAAARELSLEIGTFRWLESVAKKGDGARVHVGLTVQRAIEVMQAHGLDAFRYGFVCYDQWDALPEMWQEWPDEYDKKGELVRKAGREKVQDATPAGDRYGFRPDQLMLFIARGFEARLSALENAK